MSATEDRLYVADTNNDKIRTVDLKTHAVKTLALEGLTPPRLAPRPPSFPNKKVIDVAAARRARAGRSIDLGGARSPWPRASSSTKRFR